MRRHRLSVRGARRRPFRFSSSRCICKPLTWRRASYASINLTLHVCESASQVGLGYKHSGPSISISDAPGWIPEDQWPSQQSAITIACLSAPSRMGFRIARKRLLYYVIYQHARHHSERSPSLRLHKRTWWPVIRLVSPHSQESRHFLSTCSRVACCGKLVNRADLIAVLALRRPFLPYPFHAAGTPLQTLGKDDHWR